MQQYVHPAKGLRMIRPVVEIDEKRRHGEWAPKVSDHLVSGREGQRRLNITHRGEAAQVLLVVEGPIAREPEGV